MIKTLLQRYNLLALLLLVGLAAMPTQAAEWYEGGTLHEASALEWQQGTQENKLATAGYLLGVVASEEMLAPKITGSITELNSFLPLATKLAAQLDVLFEVLEDEEENNATYADQKVVSTAGLLMMLNGWLK